MFQVPALQYEDSNCILLQPSVPFTHRQWCQKLSLADENCERCEYKCQVISLQSTVLIHGTCIYCFTSETQYMWTEAAFPSHLLYICWAFHMAISIQLLHKQEVLWLVGPYLSQHSTQSLEKSRRVCNWDAKLGHESPALRYLLCCSAVKWWARLCPKSLQDWIAKFLLSHRAVVQSALTTLKSLNTSFKMRGLTS